MANSSAILLKTNAWKNSARNPTPYFEVNVPANASWESATLLKIGPQLEVRDGIDSGFGIAWANFEDKLATTGWTKLSVETKKTMSVSQSMRMYSAGYIEGLLTAKRMSQFYSNMWQTLAKDSEGSAALVNIQVVYRKALKYVKKKTRLSEGFAAMEPADPYWKQIRYLLAQLCGIKDGYNKRASQLGQSTIDLLDLFIINTHGSLSEMMVAFTPKAMERRRQFQRRAGQNSFLQSDGGPRRSKGEKGHVSFRVADRNWENRLAQHGHCSALVRVTPDTEDVLAGHTTWNDYGRMTRIFKYYKFDLSETGAVTRTVTFSSYPGCVGSTDNFYTMDSGIVAMDTSLEVLNERLYDRVAEFDDRPTVPNFLHVSAINRIARTGAEWANMFVMESSGLPSAQWLILDYNRFVKGQPIAVNTLRLIEQVPGLSRHADMSEVLRDQGYWASYNRPFFSEVRDVSGHTDAENVYGSLFSFAHGPRATIFEHYAKSVANLGGMRALMRRNAFPSEGILPNEPGHAVSARMDLDPVSHIPNGGIDAKVVNSCLFRKLQCQTVSGPTAQGQPVFRWKDEGGGELFPGWPHLGLPDVWNFDWVQMTNTSVLTKASDVC